MWTLAALIVAGASGAASPPLSDAIQRVDPIEYRVELKGWVCVYAPNEATDHTPGDAAPLYLPFVAEGAYPLNDRSQMDEFLLPAAANNPRAARRRFEIVPMNGLGDYAAQIEVYPVTTKISYDDCGTPPPVDFTVREYVTVYAARVDESALARAHWPEQWPTEVQLALQPQTFIESDHEQIVKLMNDWTHGQPKSKSPYYLGKELARQVVAAYQPSGLGVVSRSTGTVESLIVKGAYAAAARGAGSPHDGVCLFVALCRAAGLPARPVIGVEVDSQERELISWAEFYVPSAGWVSVNFDRLRDGPGMLRDINRPWPGLGTDKELNERIPLSYHFILPAIQPTGRVVSQPTLWNWSQSPDEAMLRQKLEIDINKAPKRSSASR